MATEIKWTDEQESAINYPSDSSACVSAAAGSGKTALLVERVVRLIRGNEAADIPPDASVHQEVSHGQQH